MLENFRVFHMYKSEVDEATNEDDNNPLRAKADWVSIEESELTVKKTQLPNSSTKSLPGKT